MRSPISAPAARAWSNTTSSCLRLPFESAVVAWQAVSLALVGAGFSLVWLSGAALPRSLLPLALSLGAGSELQRPLAVVVIGGLAFSTIATLLILPSLAGALLTSRGSGTAGQAS